MCVCVCVCVCVLLHGGSWGGGRERAAHDEEKKTTTTPPNPLGSSDAHRRSPAIGPSYCSDDTQREEFPLLPPVLLVLKNREEEARQGKLPSPTHPPEQNLFPILSPTHPPPPSFARLLTRIANADLLDGEGSVRGKWESERERERRRRRRRSSNSKKKRK